MNHTKIENHLSLLRIRLSARRRDAIILGGIFFIGLIAILIFGLIGNVNTREITLITTLTVVNGIAALTNWVKFESIRGNIDVLTLLLDENQRGS